MRTVRLCKPNGIATRNVDEDYELGTWSFDANSVLSSYASITRAIFLSKSHNSSYSNIDWSAFESAKGCLRVALHKCL